MYYRSCPKQRVTCLRLADINLKGSTSRPAWSMLLLLVLVCSASAERLPIKTYTTADGLPRDNITRIVQDSKGFLWFCTSEGLSRFDGYNFTNYGIEHGLPNRAVTSLLIGRSGVYWVGTWAGLFRFDPNSSPPQRFEPVPLRSGGAGMVVYALAED